MVLFAFVFPISLGGANSVLGLILVLWIIEGNFGHKLTIIKNEKIIWIFFAIGLLTLFSALLSESMSHSFLAGEKKSLVRVILSHYLMIPMILVIALTSIKKAYLEHIISAFLLAILASEIVSYLIFFQVIDVTALQAKHFLYTGASIHNPTPFMHHTEYSVFLSVAAIFLLHKLIHTPNRYFQFFILLFLMSATTNLFINGGRTGQISYILGIMTYMIFHFKFNIKIILSTFIVLCGILLTAYSFSPTFQQRSHMAIQDIHRVSQGHYDKSWGLRVAAIKVTLDYLFSSPGNFILGAGAGDCRQNYLTYAKEHFSANISEPIKVMAHLHNQYLEYWMDGTVFSLLLFLLYFFLLLKLPVPPAVKPILYAFIVIIAFASTTDIPFFRYQPAMLFMLISAYFILLSKKDNQGTVTQ